MIDILSARIVPLILIGFILKDAINSHYWGYFIFLSVSYGLGAGANVRIANLLGENNLERAKKSTIIAICYELTIVTGFSVVIFSFSYYISYIFTSVEDIRKQIEFGIKILTIALLSDVGSCLKGICNACCLQYFALASEIIFFFFISVPLGCGLSYFVTWKAMGSYIFLSIGYLASAITLILILFCYDWQKIAKKVSQNISQINQEKECSETDLNNNLAISSAELSKCRIFLLVSRYLIILVISIIMFILVCFFEI